MRDGEQPTERPQLWGEVRLVTANRLALVAAADGGLTVVEQTGGVPLLAGHFLSGLVTGRGPVLLRNESTGRDVVVFVLRQA